MSKFLYVSISAFALISSVPTFAQDANSVSTTDEAEAGRTGLNVIVVTARKREESSQDVPISLTALSVADLDRQQVRNLEDISSSVPNLSIAKTQGSGNVAQIFLRGVGQDDNTINVEPAIGLYVDGVPYVKAVGALLDLIEFDRIEVLRGPQGTLYGRNSTGGAVKFETRRPSFDDLGYVADLTVGSFSRLDGRGSVNIPLADNLAVKADFISRSDDGFVDNASYGPNGDVEKDLNRTNRQSARLSALWEPTERLSIFASIDGTRDRSGVQSGIPLISSADADNIDAATGNPNRARPLFGERLADPDIIGPNTLDALGGQITANLDLDTVVIQSISGYRSFDLDQAIDTNGGGAATGLVSQNGDIIDRSAGNNLTRYWEHDTFTQELQVASAGENQFSWIFGAFYMNEKNKSDLNFGSFNNDDTINQRASGFNTRQTTTSFAIFGELSVRMFERLELTAGARYTWDQKDYSRRHFAAFGLPIFTGNPYFGETTVNFKKLTPRVIAKFEVTDDVMTYASWSRGFQAGAFQTFAFASAENSNTPFNETTVDTFEAGFKGQFFDDRVTFNANFFHSDYSNIPSSILSNSGAFEVVTNDARIWGTEFELAAEPVDGLIVYGNLSTLNDKYTNSNLAPSRFPGANDENRLKFTPKLKWKLGAEYSAELNYGTISFGGSVAHTGNYVTSTVNTPFGFQESYQVVDAQVSFESTDQRWKLTAAGKNLTDTLYAPQLGAAGSGAAFFAAPTNWSLTLRVKG